MPDYISRQGEAWDQIALSRLSGEHQMGDVLALNVDELDALLENVNSDEIRLSGSSVTQFTALWSKWPWLQKTAWALTCKGGYPATPS